MIEGAIERHGVAVWNIDIVTQRDCHPFVDKNRRGDEEEGDMGIRVNLLGFSVLRKRRILEYLHKDKYWLFNFMNSVIIISSTKYFGKSLAFHRCRGYNFT